MDKQVVFAIAIVFSVVASLLVPSKRGWRGRLWNAVGSAVVGSLLTTLMCVFFTLLSVEEHLSVISSNNPYTRVARQIAEMSERTPLIESRKQRLKTLEKDLEQLERGTITLPNPHQVLEQWLKGIRSARREILATNVVDPRTWRDSEELKEGREAQKAAIESDARVSINRVWIYPRTGVETQSILRSIAEDQKTLGIRTKYLTSEDLFSQEFVTGYQSELGSVDIVIFDGAFMLVTVADPSDWRIRGGYVTTNSEKIQAGRELFDRLWQMGKEGFYK